jgi:O-acetyl-ADP-ribose deacetylase (regulator of RNase III)
MGLLSSWMAHAGSVVSYSRSLPSSFSLWDLVATYETLVRFSSRGCDGCEARTVGNMADIEAIEGDITTQDLDAIVNAANSSLLGGGGVDGAIHRAAGPSLLAECQELRRTTHPDGLPVGRAVATGAGNLRARWVIHTVGPNRHLGQTDPALLASCFISALAEAVRVGAQSIAFPAVSAGVYGWDIDEVARIAVDATRAADTRGITLVRFVLFGRPAYEAFRVALT